MDKLSAQSGLLWSQSFI